MTFSPIQPTGGATQHDDDEWRRQVAITRVDGAFSVLAARPIAMGEVVLHLNGRIADRPSRFSVQVGASRHIEIPLGAALEEQLDRYPWRFLNHACEPNAAFRGRDLIATRSIQWWEEVSFDYTTTEFDMAVPFACSCGSPECLGMVSGYRGLSAIEQRRRLGRLAPHLGQAARDAS